MYRPILVVALASALTSASSVTPVAPISRRLPTIGTTLQDTLVDLEQQSWVAWKKRDGSYFKSFLADDHVEVGASGVADKATVVGFVGSPACVVDRYAVSAFKATRFNATAAVLTYRVDQTTRCGGQPVPSPAWATSVFVLRNGRWQNAVYQQTPEKP